MLLSWTSSTTTTTASSFYGAPVDYRIETSADSTDGADGTWRTAVTVRGNPVRSRRTRWTSAGSAGSGSRHARSRRRANEWGLFLDEIDVHDLSLGGDDVWVFLGDTIGAGVFDRAPPTARASPTGSPRRTRATARHDRRRASAARAPPRCSPGSTRCSRGTRTRGSSPSRSARTTATPRPSARARRAGRAHPGGGADRGGGADPFQTKYGEDFAAPKNAALDEVVARAGSSPAPTWTRWFRARPERLEDGLHPDAEGSIAASRLWAEAVAPLYPRCAGVRPRSGTRARSGAAPARTGRARPDSFAGWRRATLAELVAAVSSRRQPRRALPWPFDRLRANGHFRSAPIDVVLNPPSSRGRRDPRPSRPPSGTAS